MIKKSLRDGDIYNDAILNSHTEYIDGQIIQHAIVIALSTHMRLLLSVGLAQLRWPCKISGH